MASSGSFNTGGYQGRCLRFEWWENAQSIEGNYTDIGYQLKGYGTATSTWYMAGNFKLVVNGSTVYETAESNRIKLYNGTVLKTGTMRIYHNADGSKSFSASATGGIYTYARNVSGSGSWALDKIPRAATISSAPNFTDEDNPVIKYSNPAGTVVDDLQACIASTDGSTVYIDYRAISETGDSYTFNLTDDERETLQSLCKNAKSMKVKFYIRTKLGSSTLYSSVEKTLTIANAAPTLSPTVKDTNATTVALTGDEATFIKGHSNAAFTVGASALKLATIKSQGVTCGDKSSSSESGTLSAIESGTFTFSVTDSRGYTTTKKLTKTLIDYVELTCSMKASNPTADGDMAMRISGSYFNGSFGATANTLTVQYRQSTDGGSTWGAWVTVEAVLSAHSYTADVELTGLDYRQAYTFQARAIDKLATVNTALKTVKALPVFEWGEDKFIHNTNLYMAENGYGGGIIYGALPDEQAFVGNLQPVSENGNCVIGWGNYDRGAGNTHLYAGETVDMFVHGASSHVFRARNANNHMIVNGAGRTDANSNTYIDGNEVYIRSNEGVYIDGNLLADQIIAQGQSGTWHYWKFASGKAICTQQIAYSNKTYPTASGYGYYWSTEEIPFPFAFTERPRVFGTVWASSGLMSCSVLGLTTSTVRFFVFSTANITNSPDLFILVEGWWK